MATKSKSKNKGKVTPLMQQYFQVKAKHPEALLLFRVGDFYETFGEDAIKTAHTLGIILTKRNNGGSDIELAGFPHHSLDVHMPKLVRAGFRVAVCEQLEKPSPQKKIVKRGVTEIVTPGIAIDDKLLDHKSNNYLSSIHYGRKNQVGVAFLDISTGEFMVCEGSLTYADKLFQSFNPSELIFSKDKSKDFENYFGDKFYTFKVEEWVYTLDYTREKLLEHFEVQNLKGFGIEAMELAQIAAGAILHYLATTENKNLKHINSISRIQPDNYVWLDRFTIRNLELVQSNHETGIPLIGVLDHTISPMGARLLKKWVLLPLKSNAGIQARLNIVEFLIENLEFTQEMEGYLGQIGDLERLISKVPMGKINPREVVQLKRALSVLEPLKSDLTNATNDHLQKIGEGLNPCPKLRELIETQVVEEPPVNLNKGGVIADGFDESLDEYRHIVKHSKDILLNIQRQESERTGITSLKIGFNNVFGYYLEVTNRFKDKVPEEWIRKQTLTNSERYITEELKQLEVKILNAEEQILGIEERLFEDLINQLNQYIQPIQFNAHLVAKLDCLIAFARVALKNNYCKPTISEDFSIDIRAGRHPVIERHLPIGENYVPNDVFLDRDNCQIMMITGPNMSGKSALLRQTALICLMAQMGSYVPASSASLGIVDKVFTRVGASDNISSGESTFMVEMNETASIMNNISDRSLILLDEIGRGTSTYDGISIAWSIAEFLHNNGAAQPKTLFATHYHELNELANQFNRIHNFNVATKEVGQKVIFLRKLVPGGSQHSFGIHVAKMAGMPRGIVERAARILTQLEQKFIDGDRVTDDGINVAKPQTANITPDAYQLSIFETADPKIGQLKEAILSIEINSMTPIECMMKLHELKKLLDE